MVFHAVIRILSSYVVGNKKCQLEEYEVLAELGKLAKSILMRGRHLWDSRRHKCTIYWTDDIPHCLLFL